MNSNPNLDDRPVPTEESTRAEWDFEQVAQDQLLLCCYWEYARESARIRAAFDPEDIVYFPKPVPTYIQSPTGQRLKTTSEINIARMQFTEHLRHQALPVLEILRAANNQIALPLDKPWLLLPPAVKSAALSELAPYFAEKPGLTYLPFNRCSDLRDLGIADDQYRCAQFDDELGIERLRVEIDWGGFQNS
jgi:hypothetical protein